MNMYEEFAKEDEEEIESIKKKINYFWRRYQLRTFQPEWRKSIHQIINSLNEWMVQVERRLQENTEKARDSNRVSDFSVTSEGTGSENDRTGTGNREYAGPEQETLGIETRAYDRDWWANKSG